MDCSMPGLPVLTISRSLLKLMSLKSVMPSNSLVLCHPLLLPLIFPSVQVFSSESALRIRWPKHESAVFCISWGGKNHIKGLSKDYEVFYFIWCSVLELPFPIPIVDLIPLWQMLPSPKKRGFRDGNVSIIAGVWLSGKESNSQHAVQTAACFILDLTWFSVEFKTPSPVLNTQ